MNAWKKISTLNNKSNGIEIWISNSKSQQEYTVNVLKGKPIDICSLKLPTIENLESQMLYHKISRTEIYSSIKERLSQCPICKSDVNESESCISIYGVVYSHCKICDHYYIIEKPTQSALDKFYGTSENYSSVYIDKKTLDVRINQVVIPKLEWLITQFSSLYGRKPKKILDVGAGAGHFVYACRQCGFEAHGLEISETSRNFCKTNFGFCLENGDFTKVWDQYQDFDVITFWGVIEHIACPTDFLNAASKALKGRETMIIAEVPRWDCLGTAVQKSFPTSVIRHLDPLGHIHCFSDSSLATAFETSGFAPCAAWYYGMDIYELMIQISYHLHDDRVINAIKPHISTLQEIIDYASVSDTIALAGRPVENTRLF